MTLALPLTGLQLIEQIRAVQQRQIPAILITGSTSADINAALQDPSVDVCFKPLAASELAAAIRKSMNFA